jgi:uncharacterized phage-associated protein
VDPKRARAKAYNEYRYMRLKFNERKATQAAARLLMLNGGRMNYMKLIKLLYIVDREGLLRWGRPITTDTYFAMKHGPVLSEVLDRISEEPISGKTFWTQHISEPQGYAVALREDPSNDQLSIAEEELIGETFEKFGRLNEWKLVDLVHTFAEWQDPQGGALEIQYADILKAVNKTPEEIQAIEGELEALNFVERFLVAH